MNVQWWKRVIKEKDRVDFNNPLFFLKEWEIHGKIVYVRR